MSASYHSLLLVFFGGGIGSVARMMMSLAIAERTGVAFPLGTLAVNVLGSFVIGLIDALLAPDGRFIASPELRQFLMLGLLGGFTTFSSFSLQTLALLRDGQMFSAGVNVVGSVLLCLLGAWIGSALGQAAGALR